MRNFRVVVPSIPVDGILAELEANPHLWNQHTFRTEYAPDSVFRDCSDIILQYNDMDVVPIDWFETVSYPAMQILEHAKFAAHTLMYAFRGDRLGRVMITKLPPGGTITEHEDSEFLVKYYNRYHICLNDNEQTEFYCGDEVFRPTKGQVFWFDNGKKHKVINNGETDRLTMIVDIRKPVMKKFYGKQELGVEPFITKTWMSKSNPEVTYSTALVSKSIEDIKEVIPHHYAELALTQEVCPLDPDWVRFVQLERTGALFMMDMRHNGKLIGYYIAMVGGHLHYKSTKHCSVDLYFIMPEYRKAGLGREFFQVVEEELKSMGVVKIVSGCKAHRDHTRFFESMGYTHSDNNFIKVIADPTKETAST